MQKSIIFGKVKVAFFCFMHLSLNIKQKFEFFYHSIKGEKLLSVVVAVVSSSVNKPLDFDDTTFSVWPLLFKIL